MSSRMLKKKKLHLSLNLMKMVYTSIVYVSVGQNVIDTGNSRKSNEGTCLCRLVDLSNTRTVAS